MGLNANALPSSGGNFVQQEELEIGNYPCRLVQVVDCGIQAQQPYEGKEKKPVQELMFTYEFTDEFLKDENGDDREDKPRWLSETKPFHPLSNDRATTTQRYFALDPTEDPDRDWETSVNS